jgi:DNA-binding beta-propeller fold protein YncE
MKRISRAARLIAAAAIACTAMLVPVVALASIGSAATMASPVSGARSARPVTAYVVNNGGTGTGDPIRTATNEVGTEITAGSGPFDIVITANVVTAYVTSEGSDTVTLINIATTKVGTPSKSGAPSAPS